MKHESYLREALEELVGASQVIDDQAVLADYIHDGSFVKPVRPLYAVRPADTEEVQAVVRLANRERIALFPFSSGTTYQGAHIPTERGIILDLRRMTAIDLLDPVARNAIIEPGVTFAQLADAARAYGLKPMTPIGAPAHASVLATYLENTPLYLWPRYKTWETLNVKMVLPTGDIMGTGQMALPASERPYNWTTNFAVLNKVFFGAQGTLGIGVKAAVALQNILENRKYILVPLDDIKKLPALATTIMRQEAHDEFFVADSTYLACLLAGSGPEIDGFKKNLPPWLAVVGISGNDGEELDYKELDIRDALEKCNLAGLETAGGIEDMQARLIQEIDRPRGMLNQRRYKGGCTYIGCMAANTQLGPFYDLALQTVCDGMGNHPEIGWMLMPLNFGGTFYFEPSLYYNPDDAGELHCAHEAFTAMSRNLIHAGAFFPRPYPMWAEEVYFRTGAYHSKIKMCKQLFDPNNILSPGKLALR